MLIRPTVKQRRLARRLRDRRLEANLTHDDAAAALGCKQPKISKIENATVNVSVEDVRVLAESYGLPVEQVESLTRLARESKTRGWWSAYADALAEGSDDIAELETDAISVSNFEADVIPGLLQSEGYARAVIRAFTPEVDDETVELRTELRMRRQQRVLHGDLSLWAVVDAGALARVVGGAYVYRGQLDHLMSMIEHPHVTFQVLPPEAGEHMALGIPFACFAFEDGAGAVTIDHLFGMFFMEEDAVVERYRLAFEHLRATALSARDSLAWVHRMVQS